MAVVRVDNVRIMDLVQLLAKLSLTYDAIDIIVDDEKKTVMIDPIDLRREADSPLPNPVQLKDDNIKDII